LEDLPSPRRDRWDRAIALVDALARLGLAVAAVIATTGGCGSPAG
jgi:hypothetical protein